MTSLHSHKIRDTDEAYYFSNFITPEEEALLIRKINGSPLPKWKQLANRRLQIWGGSVTAQGLLIPEHIPPFVNQYPDIVGRIRSTGAFGSSPHGAPNHVIMNEYHPGQGIMPHEDGPAYHPVVATLSLGSHALFHYYRYKFREDCPEGEEEDSSSSGRGRAIDPAPILSVLLEPRSLVITRSSLYTSHLHGIEDVEEDIFSLPGGDSFGRSLRIANADLLTGTTERDVVMGGGVLKRETRYSLTCRDVAKVATKSPFLKR
ncbi:hypothetical protein BKA93DRAFT_391398 [Sparassis latifolia]|uniref:Fe2OG dioxygenase domain-containing protein n=1 Tax=Sparassis crispa TaxID=139825 RepID=A0A401GXJ9_9APHY|nr:hypothetical protein SCP_1002010 [Sparassis crispa]GBE86956.1 hypothetical protein SCP_1002010 [Sparassis crispa]